MSTARRRKKSARKPPSPERLAKETRSLGARFIQIMCRLDLPGCECSWCHAKHPHPHFPTCDADSFVRKYLNGTQS